jgi:hypothetical protein
LFGKWSGTEAEIEDRDILIMKESDLLGVVEHSGKLKKAAWSRLEATVIERKGDQYHGCQGRKAFDRGPRADAAEQEPSCSELAHAGLKLRHDRLGKFSNDRRMRWSWIKPLAPPVRRNIGITPVGAPSKIY